MTDLAQTLKEISQLSLDCAKAVERGDTSAAATLSEQLAAAHAQAQRLSRSQLRRVERPMLSKLPSARERAISAVAELNVPCSARLIASYCEARTGEPFDLRAIASIRRDEYRSWKSGSSRETYLLPALEGAWLEPARGKFVLYHWPLVQRIIGPLSPRVDHLKVCIHLVGQAETLKPATPAGQRMRTLLAEYARSVAQALEDPWRASAAALDLERVRAAAQAELKVLEVDDQDWRREHAERAHRLNDEQKLWGGTRPQVVSGEPG